MATANITRGVNQFTHIFNQLIKGYISIFFITLLLWLVTFIVFFLLLNKSHDTHISKKWLESHMIKKIPMIKNKTIDYKTPDGNLRKSHINKFINNNNVKLSLSRTIKKIQLSILLSSLLSILNFVLLVMLFIKYGQKLEKGKHIRGGTIATNQQLNELLKSNQKQSRFKIGGVYLVDSLETNHMFISGATGTGKSFAIKDILDLVRQSDQKFICYDKSGEYVSLYYRENYDIILNPFDARMVNYNIWNECIDDFDYENIASSFIPSSPNENASASLHFTNSGRTLLCDTMRKLSEINQATSENLLKHINQVSLKQLHQILQGTDSQGVVNPDNERHASDVRSTVAPMIKALRYLQGKDKTGFSLKKWVRDDEDKRCVFITCKGSQKETLSPLISAWFDIFSKEIMSLKEDLNRRIWMIIDELASLPKIESLVDFANEARKFGGCGIFSVTSVEEMYRIYGRSRAKTLVGMCGTKLTYRCDEPDTAQWISRLYMEEEIKEISEGVNISNSEHRGDSVNMNDRRVNKALFMSSEIMQLDNLNCLLKLPGAYPVTKIKIKPKERKTIAEGFIEKKIKLKPIIVEEEQEQDLILPASGYPLAGCSPSEPTSIQEPDKKPKRPFI